MCASACENGAPHWQQNRIEQTKSITVIAVCWQTGGKLIRHHSITDVPLPCVSTKRKK